jgi:inosine-uridine nucleoside N-ribohydrolase
MKIIFDTDIGWMNDDCIALLMALHAPAIEVVGITPVMGNYDLAFEVESALRLLEHTGHEAIPVAAGFDRPLLHERSVYSDQMWGQWATFQKGFDHPAGHPRLKPDRRHAVDFIIETILAAPGEITVVAVGPLTNLAVAVRKEPRIVNLVKAVVVMGGGINLFPGGWGNSTPLAEFNFWVDPEAARIVLRSGLPITLLPINVCRKTHLPRSLVERIARSKTAKAGAAEMFRDYTLPLFGDADVGGQDAIERKNHLAYGLYDSCTIAWLLRPDIFKTAELSVDVITTPGLQYGMSVAYKTGGRVVDDENITFPVENPPKPITVVHDMDFDRLVELYLECVGA